MIQPGGVVLDPETFEGLRISIDYVMHGRKSEVAEQRMRRRSVEDCGMGAEIGFVALDSPRGLDFVLNLG